MNELVKLIGNDAFTDSLVIAEGTGNDHKSVKALIRAQTRRLEKLGALKFSYLKSLNPKGGRPAKIYQLNEMQATLLITFLDNTEIVADFKLELVKQFYAMRQLLLERQSPKWQETRQIGKKARRMETDEIKAFVAYAVAQGSHNAGSYYGSFSLLADKAVGLSPGDRNKAVIEQLTMLSFVEGLIQRTIMEGMAKKLYYKDVYKLCKERVQQIVAIAALPMAG